MSEGPRRVGRVPVGNLIAKIRDAEAVQSLSASDADRGRPNINARLATRGPPRNPHGRGDATFRLRLLVVVVKVSLRSLKWINVGWWDEFGQPVGSDPDLPRAVVDQPMMMFTQQHPVGQIGVTTVKPRNYVMPVAPPRWPITARKRAAPIPQDQRPAQRTREQAPLATQVQDFAGGGEDRRDDHCVAGQPAGCGRGQLFTGVQGGNAELLA